MIIVLKDEDRAVVKHPPNVAQFPNLTLVMQASANLIVYSPAAGAVEWVLKARDGHQTEVGPRRRRKWGIG